MISHETGLGGRWAGVNALCGTLCSPLGAIRALRHVVRSSFVCEGKGDMVFKVFGPCFLGDE
jgi:hypothetical protein